MARSTRSRRAGGSPARRAGGFSRISLFEEWNFANRTTLFRRGVDAHGAREVEAAVLYLVYEARLFAAEAPVEELLAPSAANAATPAVPAASAVAIAPAAAAPTVAPVAATAADAAAPVPRAGPLASAFPCPRCGAVAAERRAGECLVFPCVTCGGVWVDNAVSQRLVRANEPKAVATAEEVARFAVRPVSTRPALACPACHAALRRVVVAAIELDVCATHGTWFDRDELPRVVRALTRPPEQIVVRTAPNTITENLANAGRVAAEHLASSGHTLLDNLLDAIANVRISASDSAWSDRDSGDSHGGGGWFDGAWGGSNDSSDQSVQTGGNDSSWSDSGCCTDNDDNGFCNDNDNSNSCGDNDGGPRD